MSGKQSKTFALYNSEPQGRTRATFRVRIAPVAEGGTETEQVAAYLRKRYPKLDLSRCEAARVTRHMEFAAFPLEKRKVKDE